MKYPYQYWFSLNNSERMVTPGIYNLISFLPIPEKIHVLLHVHLTPVHHAVICSFDDFPTTG